MNHSYEYYSHGLCKSRVALARLVALIFLVASLVAAFHYHPNGEEHSGCPVCAVRYHHRTGSVFTVVLLDLPAIFFYTLFLSVSFQLKPFRYVASLPSRAPPILV